MDMGGMRAWLKQHGETYLMTERTYRTIVEEKETDVAEFRVMLLRGDMDYTAAVIEPLANVKADREEATARVFERLAWETKRDTKVEIDCIAALVRGKEYQATLKK